MELIKQGPIAKFKSFLLKISGHNLFLLSSSVSYYSALALAPFLLIILGVASFIGDDVKARASVWAAGFSPAVAKMMDIIFENIHQGVSVGSLSGFVGLVFLLWTASLVFLQLRFSFDVIYGTHEDRGRKSVRIIITDKLFAMLVVFLAGVLLIIFSALPGLVVYLFGKEATVIRALAFLINFIIYTCMFYLVHYVTPSQRPKKRDAFKMAILSSVFFIIGNVLLGLYFKGIAGHSIYGAAGSLLVFLVWCYYSSFTLFLSVEIFRFFKLNFRR